MATSYEKIRQRKIVYVLVILGLLGAAYAHKINVVDTAAKRYDISETNLGKVDLGGSISRFVLSSFRGPLVCGLWWEVDELQQRHDFKQLELMLTALTKLQPHFKGPWKYQGWNLAYNVSVEFDRVDDKYFYISKGIRWLAQGEEINRLKFFDPDRPEELRTIGDPEMRSEIAQYLSGKMYYADEQLLFRPLLHMSCIPPSQRDPVKLKNNAAELKRFKEQFPRFVRRVKTYHNIPDDDDAGLNRQLIAFLDEHKDVPCLWKTENGNPVMANDPWPRWPNMADKELIGKVAEKEIMQDGLEISRYWYEFSTEMLPTPNRDLSEDITPVSGKFTRTAKTMHSMIFRGRPAQTQSRSAQELYKEGWYVDAQQAAEKAYNLWMDLGKATNVVQPEAELRARVEQANRYVTQYKENAEVSRPPPDYLKSQNPEEYQRALQDFKSFQFINNYNKLRSFSRFDYWTESMGAAKTATFAEASRSRYLAETRYTDWPVSIEHYQRAIGLLQYYIKSQAEPPDQLALRLCLLAPDISGTFIQLTPALTNNLTGYASIDTVQEDLIELQEKYMRTMARRSGPLRLRAEFLTWELKQALSNSLIPLSPGVVYSPTMFPMTSRDFLNIDFVEDLTETDRGPFDSFLSEQIKSEKGRDKLGTRK